jgi:acetyltransferase-like isoleucine patch superfamily enzyme
MLINHGVAADPWTLGRVLSEDPEIHPTALVRASDFGRYTYLGPRSHVAESVIGDYGYAMGDNQIAHAHIGKFANIATGVRINPPNHPSWRATHHHFTYRSRSYGLSLDDDAGIFQWRAKDRVEIGHDVWLGHDAIVMPGVTIGTGAAIGSRRAHFGTAAANRLVGLDPGANRHGPSRFSRVDRSRVRREIWRLVWRLMRRKRVGFATRGDWRPGCALKRKVASDALI